MHKISSGIKSLDELVDSFYIGDNVVWEVDAGTSYEKFIHNFVKQSFNDSQKIIYISFNRSPHSIINEINSFADSDLFVLVDCFTSGKGQNDNTFLRFYAQNKNKINIVRIENPKNINEFTQVLNSIEDSLPSGVRYVFDSLTGMQDLWGDENNTYKFFTYMCPRLYDLETVAYWILEKEAHSKIFKANLRHITQVVFDLYKRRDSLFIKALKLAERKNREAFKTHNFEINNDEILITESKKETSIDIGSRIKGMRARLGMSQKELAAKIGLTTSFISQVENNQVSPSLNSFLQISSALGRSPIEMFQDTREKSEAEWFLSRGFVRENLEENESGYSIFKIMSGENTSAYITVIKPGASFEKHFLNFKKDELIHILSGNVSVKVGSVEKELRQGDSIHLKDFLPEQWTNINDKEAELLVVCF
ncbi:MAG: helix-turn-helix domain-containing protein [Nitrospiraceae bacterium]|nr:helix-turn-helix domain-containing protein [Nitrospiraceae bacterium]